MKNWILYIFCFCCGTSLWGQVTVINQLGPPPYKTGQAIPMKVQIIYPSTLKMGAISLDEFSKDFTITKNPAQFKTTQSGTNTVLSKDLVIVPKYHGDLLIPPVLAQYFDQGQETGAVSKVKKISVADAGKGSTEKSYPMPLTDETIAKMNEMLSGGPAAAAAAAQSAIQQGAPNAGADPIANPYGDIKGIKPIIEEPLKFQDFLPYLIALLILSVLGYALYYFIHKKKQPEPAPEPEVWVPAHNTALTNLKELKDKQLWQSGEVKEYQTQLTHIIRTYLQNRFEINALEMTSDDIVYHLKKKTKVSDSQQSKVKDILQIADLVKFAKANPQANINEQFWKDAENFVDETKTDEIPAAFTAKQEAIQAEYQARLDNASNTKKRKKPTDA